MNCWNCGAVFEIEDALFTHASRGGDARCPDCASSEVREDAEEPPKTRVGTPYFCTFAQACTYYEAYGNTRSNVKGKIERGEIFIGEPPIPPGATLHIDLDGRYHVGGA